MIVGIFGSSKPINRDRDYELAKELGFLLGKSGINIATGGYRGIMQASLEGASEFDVERIGVSSEDYNLKNLNKFVNHEFRQRTYLSRLEKLIEISDHYVFFPGGTGTLLELSAVLALKNRSSLEGRKVICFGEVWKELAEDLKKYNEFKDFNNKIITFVTDAKVAFEILTSK